MSNLKKYILGLSLGVSVIAYGQGFSSNNYPNSNQHLASNYTLNTPEVKTPGNSRTEAREAINLTLDQLVSDPVLRNANWGFALYDPETRKIVSSYNESAPLIPASTTKLLTTETAMNLLGPDYVWTTQLEYSGEIDENGVLNGDLYLVGSGDPSLGSNKGGAITYGGLINEMIAAMKEQGIKKVNGNLILQTAVFKDNKNVNLPANIVWMDYKNYYLPVGSTDTVDPHHEKLIARQKSPLKEGKDFYYISPYTHKPVYTDQYSGGSLTTAVAEIPAYLKTNLRLRMIKSGLPVTGKVMPEYVASTESAPRKTIYTYKSPKLSEIIYYTNQHSDNALAESLLRMVGFQKKGDQTLASGRSTVVEHLEASGFDTTGLNYVDGSGLSRAHTVTPISQVKFLASLMKKDYYPEFFNSLPIGGQTGTLKRMFAGSGYGHVFAKTGTLNRVKTLAGYVKTNSGKTLVFSFLANNYAGSVTQIKSRMEEALEPVINLY